MTFTAERYRFMRSIGSLGAATAMLVMAGCKNLDVGNLNGVSADQLTSSPTKTQIVTGAQSLVNLWRTTDGTHAGTLSQYGFEYWSFRSSEPRGLTNIVATPLTSGFWSYGTIENINLLLSGMNSLPSTAMTDAEKAGVRAWLNMNLAVQLEDMAQAHDTFGIVLDLPSDPLNGAPAPIADKATVWARLFTLMDSSFADLGRAGTSFAFKLSSGYAGYNTPATMKLLNRALKARWLKLYAVPLGRPGYNAQAWADVLTALSGTFINPAAPSGAALTAAQLRAGPYHVYEASTTTNPLNTIDRYSNTRYQLEAQCKTAGSIPAGHTCQNDSTGFSADGKSITYTPSNRDGRAFGSTAKVVQLTQTKSDNLLLYGTTLIIRILEQADILNPVQSARIGTTSPLPIIRNEELLLIRAEAYINGAVGGAADCATAVKDLNSIRTSTVVGLPALTCPYAGDPALNQPASLEDELLYERRFSLWGEIGTVWLDMRQYGKSNLIPHWDPSFRIFDIIPIPNVECDVRGYTVKGCFSTGYAGILGGPNTFYQPLQ